MDDHRRAEALMGDADRAMAVGDRLTGSMRLLEAAAAEADAFQAASVERPRTRGVLGLSSVALYRRGGDANAAARQAYKVLAEGGIPEDSGLQIEMILDELRTERLALLRPHPGGLQWALRGGRIGFGVARLETVDQKIQQIQRLAWRVFEMLAGRKFRTNQPPDADVRRAVDLLVSQPVAGSFAFRIHLGDYQQQLDDDSPDPERITTALGDVLHATASEETDILEGLVEDPDYRTLFMRLVRNLSPDGTEIGEIEVRRIGSQMPPTILTPATRTSLRHRIPRVPRVEGQGQESELRDVLRVIDLNRRRIALGPVEREQRCVVPEGLALVDLIEGLEDRPVRVTGHWQGKSFVVHDIEPDGQD